MVSGVAVAVAATLATACAAAAPARVSPVASPSPSSSPAASRPVWMQGLHFDRQGVSRMSRRNLGKSWHQGCPVPARDLRTIRLRFWGFDGAAHTGYLVANAAAVPALRHVFHAIFRARFPLHQMVPIEAYGGNDNRSMSHDNTSGFNCRYAVANGPKSWSEHAYGEAVDVDPRENPYTLDGHVYPPSGKGYVDRSRHRRGMIFASGPVVHAFDAVGWGWGGRWSSSPDYQHFSVNGR
jgi:hypothetical protein